MNSKVQRYIIEQLAGAGFAILDFQVAFKLRPDIWVVSFGARNDFIESQRRLDQYAEIVGVEKLLVTFKDAPEPVRVIARSDDDLGRRILWLTGRRVLSIVETEFLYKSEPASMVRVPETVNGKPIPLHPCARRTEMLAQAGFKTDPQFGTKVA